MDPRTTARNLLEEGLLRQTPRASRVYHAPNLVVLERDGVSLAIAPSRPHWIATNARGAEVLRLLDGRTTVLEVANKLARERREPVEATLEEVAGFLDAAHAETFVTLRPDLSPPYRGRGEAVRPGRLSELYVFVTNDCNLRCTHCYVSSGDYVPPEELTTEELKRLIDDAKELGVSRFYFTGGEPFMRKDIFELIDYVCRDAELVILSNAMYFVGKNVERLRDVASRANAELRRLFFQVSLDGPTAELHEQVRGPNSFGKTIEGIKTLVALDLTPAVSTSINVDNQDHIAATTRLVASLGVKEHHILWLQERGRAYDNDQLLIAPSAVTRIMRELRSVADEVGVVVDNETSHRVRVRGKRDRKTDLCNCGYESLDVFSDGQVYPCVWFSGAPTMACGSIRERSLRDIWLESPILEGIRQNSVQKREGCSDCHLKFLCGGGTNCSSYFDSLASRGRGSLQAAEPYCETFMDITYDLLWELALERADHRVEGPARVLASMEGEGAHCARPQTHQLDAAFEVGSFHCACVLQEDVEEGRKVRTQIARAAATRAGDLLAGPSDDLFSVRHRRDGERKVPKRALPVVPPTPTVKLTPTPAQPATAEPAFDATFDAMGQSCVELLLPMAKLVKGLATGAVLRIVTDDPAAREDLGAWCSMTGNELAFVDRKVGYATYYVRRGALS